MLRGAGRGLSQVGGEMPLPHLTLCTGRDPSHQPEFRKLWALGCALCPGCSLMCLSRGRGQGGQNRPVEGIRVEISPPVDSRG